MKSTAGHRASSQLVFCGSRKWPDPTKKSHATRTLGCRQQRQRRRATGSHSACEAPASKASFGSMPSIARGLDYYTGTVLETRWTTAGIGSVCSGGRYDNLAVSTPTNNCPASALARPRPLLAAMEELGARRTATPAQIFIPYFDAAHLNDYLKLAAATGRRSRGRGLPRPKNSANNSNTPTAKIPRRPDRRRERVRRGPSARSRTCRRPQASPCRSRRMQPP